jgi:hypothetical protein
VPPICRKKCPLSILTRLISVNTDSIHGR